MNQPNFTAKRTRDWSELADASGRSHSPALPPVPEHLRAATPAAMHVELNAVRVIERDAGR